MDFGGGTALNNSNLGHNTLTINGNNQLKSGYATVGNLINTPIQKSVDVDMTSIYENDAVSCKRTGAIISNRYVEIKDVIQAGTVPLNVKWNLLTEAVPVKVSNKIFLLTQSTKKLYMIFQGTNQVTAQTWSTNPDNLSVNPFPGTIFTGFEFSIPPGVTQTVTVKLVPEGDPVLNELLLSTTTSKQMSENHTITAFFDEANCRICVTHLPESAKRIKLFDPVGRLLNDVRVYGDFAMLECNRSVSSVLIVQVILADGSYLSAKVLR